MVNKTIVGAQLGAIRSFGDTDFVNVLDEYGQDRTEILGYALSFREFLSPTALGEVLQFLTFLVLLYERNGDGRLKPDEDLIRKENKRVTKMVKYVLTEPPESLAKTCDLWIKGFEEKNVFAYAHHDVLLKYDMSTEEGLQVYIAIVSLVLIFSAKSKERSRRGNQ
jgi:hypothetical protein